MNSTIRGHVTMQLMFVLLLALSSLHFSTAAVRGKRHNQIYSVRRLQDGMNSGGGGGGMGMTNEPTAAPSRTPTPAPTKTPSTSPTPAPTVKATMRPNPAATNEPTSTSKLEPTASGLIETTFEPTSDPTDFSTSVPTLAPSTDKPSRFPSKSPKTTLSPTTLEPTHSASVVTMPVLMFTVQLIPETTIDIIEMESLLEIFLREFLRNDAVYRDSFVNLNVSSDTNYNKQTGVAVITSGGSAVFRGQDQPSDDDIKEILTTYFSFWGASDLQSDIGEAGYPILNIRVKIDGVHIKSKAATTPTSAPVDAPSASLHDTVSSNPILIGAVAAAGALCVITAFVVHREHKRRQRVRLENGEKTFELTTNDEDGPDAPSPRISNRKSSRKGFTTKSFVNDAGPPSPGEDMEDVSLSDVVSSDGSLFISIDGRSNVSERSYDLSRLDMIISNAKAQEWVPEEAPATPKQSNIGRR